MGFIRYLVLRASLANKNVWFWGVFFSLFWIILAAYIFTRGGGNIQYGVTDAARQYMADWLTFASVYMPTGLMVGYLYMLVYSTGAIPYFIRFGRLKPLKYLASYYIAMVAVTLILAAIIIAMAIPIMWSGFNYNGVHVSVGSLLPTSAVDALGFVGVIALNAVFMSALMFLVFLLALRLPKHITRIAFIPMYLFFIFYFLYMFGSIPKAAIPLVPLVGLLGLMVSTYTGYNGVPTELAINYNIHGYFIAPSTVPAWQVVAGTLTWIIVLTALSVLIISNIKYEPPELIRGEA